MIEDVAPVRSPSRRPGVWIADFGRTTAGWARLRVSAPAGTTISLTARRDAACRRHRCRARTSTSRATGSSATNTLPPATVSRSGSRASPTRVSATSRSKAPQPRRLVRCGWCIPTSGRSAGSHRAQPLYEQIEQAMRRTVLNNLHGIPTDTPFFEKNGWTGDAQVGAPTMAGQLDLARFFTKWLGDLRDSQARRRAVAGDRADRRLGFHRTLPRDRMVDRLPVHPARDAPLVRRRRGCCATTGNPSLRYLAWELDRVDDGLSLSVLGDWLPPGYPRWPAAGGPPADRYGVPVSRTARGRGDRRDPWPSGGGRTAPQVRRPSWPTG